MALNSLYPDGWFALGDAALKARDVEKALDAFTRTIQLDPENGEAWNNIACLHMIRKKKKESFIAFKEALKYKHNSWQLWENYSHVARDVGNIFQMLRHESNAELWGIYARWHRINGDLTMCSKALSKQVRSYQGSGLWKDGNRSKRFANSSLELCKICINISSSTSCHRELLAAEMHLQTILEQARSFSGMEELRNLEACLDEVKMKLQSKSVVA